MYYNNVGVSELEIPLEKSLVIYISQCTNNCLNCHTPYMKEKYGDSLNKYFREIYLVYKNYITCVCFMGEGLNNQKTKEEFKKYCDIIHNDHKLTALYSGRDCLIEDWMEIFDYVKIGSYKEKYGPLTKKTTNQRLYKKINNQYKDITYLFWR